MAGKKGAAEEEIDRLFSLDPGEFIAARDQLATRLKAEGKAAEAAEVRSLRRPTVAAWAANQVARQRPSDVEELVAAGNDLRQAQRKALSGVKGGFREAMDRRRKAVAALVKAADKILADVGKGSAGTVEAVQATFEAASIDEQAGEQLRAGRLEKELSAVAGFGGVTGLEVVAAPRESPPAKKKTEKEQDSARVAELKEARQEAKELQKAAVEARRKAMKARAEADRAQAKAEQLMRETEEARAGARDAASRARAAESEADRAQGEADRNLRRLEA
jgi:hypothetical protein